MQSMKLSAFSIVTALAFGATAAAAQTTDTLRLRVSKERIPVTKDTVTTTSTGEVVTPAPAPVYQPAPAPVAADTFVQTTTVAEVVPVRRALLGNNLYIGLGGGALVPTGDLRNGYDAGWNATGVIGWEPPASILGLRGTITYGQVSGDEIGTTTTDNPDPQIWSVLGHLKLKLPMSWAERAGFYLIGGGGWNQIRNYNSAAFETGTPSGAYVTVNNWSIDGGAGVDIPIGVADLFIEGRWTRVFSHNNTTPAASANRNTSYAPLIIGFRVF